MPPREVMEALNIDPTAFDIAGSNVYLAKTYDLVEQMKPLYLEYRGTPICAALSSTTRRITARS